MGLRSCSSHLYAHSLGGSAPPGSHRHTTSCSRGHPRAGGRDSTVTPPTGGESLNESLSEAPDDDEPAAAAAAAAEAEDSEGPATPKNRATPTTQANRRLGSREKADPRSFRLCCAGALFMVAAVPAKVRRRLNLFHAPARSEGGSSHRVEFQEGWGPKIGLDKPHLLAHSNCDLHKMGMISHLLDP